MLDEVSAAISALREVSDAFDGMAEQAEEVRLLAADLRDSGSYVSEIVSRLQDAVLGSEQQAKDVMKGLKSAAGWLRREVGHKVQLRYAPELVFELDESITRGAHISEMLHELKNEGKLGGEDEE